MKKMNNIKMNNKGFSLVELIIAIAILAVVSGIILTFMTTSSNIFKRNSSDVDIQTEAQMVANSITDLVIDCEKNVINITVDLSDVPGGASGTKTYDQANSFEVGNDKSRYFIFYEDSVDKLFYVESTHNGTKWTDYDGKTAEVLGQNITNFSYDLSGLKTKKRLMTFSLTYEVSGRSYTGNYKVHMRNTLKDDASYDVPDNEGKVESIVVSPNPVILWYHLYDEDYQTNYNKNIKPSPTQFFAKVKGTSIFLDTGVTWSINGADTGFKINDKGQMEVLSNGAAGIKKSEFDVVATSTKDNTISGAAKVRIKKIDKVSVVTMSGIYGKTDDGKYESTVKKGTVKCVAEVSGENLVTEDCGVTWDLYYKTSSGEPLPLVTYDLVNKKYVTHKNNDIATLTPGPRTCSVKLGNNSNSDLIFTVTARSVKDQRKLGDYKFGVTQEPGDAPNKELVRGAYIDLIGYFMANGVEDKSMKWNEITKVVVTQTADEDGETITWNRGDNQLFLDYNQAQWVDDRFFSSGGRLYRGFEQINCSVTGLDVNGNIDTKDGKIYNFPGVRIRPASSERNIFLEKGKTEDIGVKFIGYNFTDKNLISLWVKTNEGGSEYQDDMNAPGNENINRYISAKVTSNVGTKTVPKTDATVGISGKLSEPKYPIEGIKFFVAYKDYYPYVSSTLPESSDPYPWHTPDYTIYITNVENKKVFVPGPESILWSDDSYWKDIEPNSSPKSLVNTTYQKYPSYGPNKLTVEFKKEVKDISEPTQVTLYYMKYDGEEYLYNSSLRFWKKK